jgi:hypothetical protein
MANENNENVGISVIEENGNQWRNNENGGKSMK